MWSTMTAMWTSTRRATVFNRGNNHNCDLYDSVGAATAATVAIRNWRLQLATPDHIGRSEVNY